MIDKKAMISVQIVIIENGTVKQHIENTSQHIFKTIQDAIDFISKEENEKCSLVIRKAEKYVKK